MNTAYEYITFAGNSGYLWQVFNAIATLMGSGGFESLIMATTMLGFIFVVGVGAFKLDLKPFTMWFFGLILVWYGFMIPKVDVMIVDRTQTQGPMIVSNVPLGFAMPASYVSQVGDYLTTSMESLFSLPNDLQYSENGMLFGSKIYQNLSKSVLDDRVLQSDWAAFMNNCTLYDIVLYNLISPKELKASTNLMETLGKTNQALFVNISKGTQTTNALGLPTMEYGTGKDMMYCNLAYVELKKRTEMDTRAQMFKLAKITDQTGGNTNITAQYNKFVGGLDATYSTFLGGVSKNAMDSVMQHTMINVLKEGEIQNATNNGNNERLGSALAAAQAERATLLSMKAGGMTASTMLPMIKNVIEGVIISLFPIAVMCAFLALGAMWNVLQAYFMALIWIQLWPPLFAIMNLAMTAQTRNNVAGFVNQFNGDVGVSLANSSEILKEFASMENIASGMLWSIPVIAGAIVQGMKSLAGASLMGMAKGAESASSSAAGAIASGNINIGNVQSGNQNSNKRDTSQSYNSGTATVNSGSMENMRFTPGAQNAAQFQNNPISGASTRAIASTFQIAAAKANTESQAWAATYEKTVGSAINQMYQKMSSEGMSSSFTKGIMSQLTPSQQDAFIKADKAAEQMSASGQLSKGEALQSLLNNTFTAKIGAMTPLGGGEVSAQTSKQQADKEELMKTASQAASALKETGASLQYSQLESMSKSEAVQNAVQAGDTEAVSFSKTVSNAEQAKRSQSDSFNRSKSYSETATRLETKGASLSTNERQTLDNLIANSPDLLNTIQNNTTASIASAAQSTNFGSSVDPAPKDKTEDTTGQSFKKFSSQVDKTTPASTGEYRQEIQDAGSNLERKLVDFTGNVNTGIVTGREGVGVDSEKVLAQNVKMGYGASPYFKPENISKFTDVNFDLQGETPPKQNPPTHGPVSRGGMGFPSKVSNKVGRKWENLAKGSNLTDLAKVISLGEGHYHSVNLGEKNGNVSSTRNLSEMTVGEIMQRQANREFNAVGRYQMIRGTFAEGVQKLGISKNAKFTPELQDKLYREYLIPKAGGGAVARYLKGQGSKQDAVIGMAMEWRSIADPRTGKTYADRGAKGNKASIPAFVIGSILENIKNNQ